MRPLKILSWLPKTEMLWTCCYGEPDFYGWLQDQALYQGTHDFYNIECHWSSDCCSDPTRYDMLWIDNHQANNLTAEQIAAFKNIVVFDDRDSFLLYPEHFKWSTHENVKCIVMHAMYSNEDDYSTTLQIDNHLCGTQIIENMDAWERPQLRTVITRRDHETQHRVSHRKIIAVNSFPWYQPYAQSLLGRASQYVPWDNRPIDIGFCGSLKVYMYWSVRHHRVQAVQAMRNLPPEYHVFCGGGPRPSTFGPGPGRFEHFAMLQMSKVALSPWGYTEDSIRDVEAVMAGALCLKPDVLSEKKMLLEWETWPELGHCPIGNDLKVNRLPLYINHSNLEQVLKSILENREALEHEASEKRKKLLYDMAHPQVFVKKLVQGVLAKCGF